MKIGILGSGNVAQALAKGFIAQGYSVTLGTRNPATLGDFVAANPAAAVTSPAEAAAFGHLLVLAVKGTVAQLVLSGVQEHLAGKVLIDTTDPIMDAPPVQGVLQFFTGPNDSLGERLQNKFPQVRVVKAFNSVGSAFMVNPQFAGGPPTMFIAGNDADMGAIEASRALEPLCQLWCLPGFLHNEWSHAFKLLK